jgi:site-specific DNA-methyltransferase (adenine-specific)
MNGDCLELMKEIPDGSVDAVLCDLPYGTTESSWDKALHIDRLWDNYKRILKPTGTVALFGSEPFSTRIKASNLARYKYDLVWEKNTKTGFQHAKNMPLKDFELISIFSGGSIGHKALLGDKRMTYNPQGINTVNKVRKSTKNKWANIAGPRPSHKGEFLTEYENYPSMVLKFKVERGFHTNQKPVPLLEYLIKTYTNEGETVLDNTMGSGSTGVAAVNTGRSFIGIELDRGYFETAEKRIHEAQERMELDAAKILGKEKEVEGAENQIVLV